MVKEGTIVLHPEDFEDFHKLAAKLFGRDPSLPGRPTKDEQEFRAFLKQFRQFKTLKETGVYDKFFDSLHKDTNDRQTSDKDGGRPRRKRAGSNPEVGMFSELLGGKFNLLSMFTEETLQETIKEGIVRYGPILGIIIIIYMLEGTVKLPTNNVIQVDREVPNIVDIFEDRLKIVPDGPPVTERVKVGEEQQGTKIIQVDEFEKVNFPPILHTSLNILIQLLRLLELSGTFLAEGLGGIVDFLNDPIGSVVEGGQQTLNAILGIDPDETPEERKERHDKGQERIRESIKFKKRF